MRMSVHCDPLRRRHNQQQSHTLAHSYNGMRRSKGPETGCERPRSNVTGIKSVRAESKPEARNGENNEIARPNSWSLRWRWEEYRHRMMKMNEFVCCLFAFARLYLCCNNLNERAASSSQVRWDRPIRALTSIWRLARERFLRLEL